jgi:L-seryl-tRNA(Ser) seleniumtransferase
VRVTLAGRPADDLAAALRRGDPPVVARVQDGALLLDVRTLADAEVEEVAAALRRVAGA